MFTCPHCRFPLTGKTNATRTQDTYEVILQCQNCSAILRVQCTTLRSPDPEKLSRRGVNKTDQATTYCPECHGAVIIGKEKDHSCPIITHVLAT